MRDRSAINYRPSDVASLLVLAGLASISASREDDATSADEVHPSREATDFPPIAVRRERKEIDARETDGTASRRERRRWKVSRHSPVKLIKGALRRAELSRIRRERRSIRPADRPLFFPPRIARRWQDEQKATLLDVNPFIYEPRCLYIKSFRFVKPILISVVIDLGGARASERARDPSFLELSFRGQKSGEQHQPGRRCILAAVHRPAYTAALPPLLPAETFSFLPRRGSMHRASRMRCFLRARIIRSALFANRRSSLIVAPLIGINTIRFITPANSSSNARAIESFGLETSRGSSRARFNGTSTGPTVRRISVMSPCLHTVERARAL